MAFYPSCKPSPRRLACAAAGLSLLFLALLLAVTPQRALAQRSAGTHLQPQHGHMDGIPSAHQLPFAEADGVVTGVASAEAQAEFAAAAAAGRRALLHGKRRPRDYATCPRCTPVSCRTGTNACSGHCKTARALFTCRVDARVSPGCGDADRFKPDPYTLPADALRAMYSVRVTVPAPYIGCANVTGAPNGCPAAGTTGTLAGHGGVKVIASSCEQHLYVLPCAVDARTPFHPFGFCQCTMQQHSGGLFRSPCRTTFLDWSGREGGGNVPVRVSTEGDKTNTDIGVRDDADVINYVLEHTFDTQEGPLDVKMQLYNALNLEGYDIVEEGPLPGEEGGEEEEEEESALGAFLRDFYSN